MGERDKPARWRRSPAAATLPTRLRCAQSRMSRTVGMVGVDGPDWRVSPMNGSVERLGSAWCGRRSETGGSGG